MIKDFPVSSTGLCNTSVLACSFLYALSVGKLLAWNENGTFSGERPLTWRPNANVPSCPVHVQLLEMPFDTVRRVYKTLARDSGSCVHIVQGGLGVMIGSVKVHKTSRNVVIKVEVKKENIGYDIGRNGSNLNTLRADSPRIDVEDEKEESSNVRILSIPSTNESVAYIRLKITIRGTEDQILTGYGDDKSDDKRSPIQKGLKNQTQASSEPLSVQESELRAEKLISTSSDGSLTVFMSAVANPDRFWVQIMNDRAIELDQLVESMTDYYNQKANQETHRLTEVKPGQIVAALLHLDQKWYRAQVMTVSDSTPPTLELYFVDYGDSMDMPQPSVYQLNPTFLGLRFQAIECSLANVRPVGDVWSEEAISCFEDLTHVAQWKVLLARVESYKETSTDLRSGSPLPCVSLFDTSGEQDVNISHELISRGFAVSSKSGSELPDGRPNGNTRAGSNSSDSDTLVESTAPVTNAENTLTPGEANSLGANSLLPPSPNNLTSRPNSVASSTYERPNSVASNVSSTSGKGGSEKGEKKKRKF
ncbi:tudor and KH domain-containing protein homolog [Diaphorina citri]|uniref:Tudor and KH domain-containing protein homolog n=1 Tax=Diaphorina citri TaxID=121845 RepID=A0A1S3DRD8_DIACI|nr:tudor and KH domain-containing protein homolog [Diaphorina citri]